jgi:prepilin-type processing-associated H-X9-DG protein
VLLESWCCQGNRTQYNVSDSRFKKELPVGNFPLSFESLGGRFSNYVFCDGQHPTAFDFGYMSEVLRGAGFRDVEAFK